MPNAPNVSQTLYRMEDEGNDRMQKLMGAGDDGFEILESKEEGVLDLRKVFCFGRRTLPY